MKKLLLALTCFGLCSFSEAQDFAQKKVDSHTGAHASKVPVTTAGLETIHGVEKQPLVAATKRLIEALQYVGAPLAETDVAKLKAASGSEPLTTPDPERWIAKKLRTGARKGTKLKERQNVTSGGAPRVGSAAGSSAGCAAGAGPAPSSMPADTDTHDP